MLTPGDAPAHPAAAKTRFDYGLARRFNRTSTDRQTALAKLMEIHLAEVLAKNFNSRFAIAF